MNFPSFPAYKRSGVDWLGAVPEHWDSKRLKFLFTLVKREVREEDRIVTCFRDGTVTLRDNRRTDGFTNALKEIGYQGIRVGDLVIHAMDAFAGAIGVSDSNGKSSPVYSVCIPLSPDVSAGYYARLLRNMAVAGFVSSLAKGIRERSTDFRWTDASEIFLPVPPAAEQQNIVSFLDHETVRIDALIEEQQCLIELLKEKRQAVISLAVTKGLDPTAPMKDSGVEWLGEVPTHWAVAPTSYRYEIQLGRMLNEQRAQGEYLKPYLRVFDVQWNAINTLDLPLMDFPPEAQCSYRLKSGDLLVNEGGSYVGRSAIWRGELDECYYQKALHRLRPRDSRNDTAEFFLYVMEMATQRGVFVAGGNQTTIDHLTAEQLRQYRFAFPPLKEQQQIASHISKETSKISCTACEAEKLIALLQERRAALISAAVTGKIDVRCWQPAARGLDLPELERDTM